MDFRLAAAPLLDSWLKISPLVSNIIFALVLLLAGWLAAKGASSLIIYLLKLAQLDKAAKRIAFNLLLEKADIKKTAPELIGDLAYWVIIFVAVITAAHLLNLAIDPALNYLFSYLGIVFLAALVLGFGLFFASLISGIVRVVAANIGIEGAKTLSRVIYYIVVIFSFLAALAQLGVSIDVFVPQIGVIIGAFGLAAAIAFGLGCKDMAADFLHNLFKGR